MIFRSPSTCSHSVRLTSSIVFYKSLIGIRSVEATSPYQLRLEYSLPPNSGSDAVVLLLNFDWVSRRLAGAEVSCSEQTRDSVDTTRSWVLMWTFLNQSTWPWRLVMSRD